MEILLARNVGSRFWSEESTRRESTDVSTLQFILACCERQNGDSGIWSFTCGISDGNGCFRGPLACELAYNAVKTVLMDEGGRKEMDIKRYAKVEKVPGGAVEDSRVLDGVMINKDVTHAKMKR